MSEIDEHLKLKSFLAEHVMGWRLKEDIGDMALGEYRISGGGIIFKAANTQRRCFDPINDWKDAGLVLQKCAEKTWPTVYKSRATDEWCVDNQGQHEGQPIICTAETLPLAIVKFARALYGREG